MSFGLFNRLVSMDKFDEKLSFVSYLILLPFFVIITAYPLNFMWNEVALIIAADIALSFLIEKTKIISKLYSCSDAFYPNLNSLKIRSLSEDELESMIDGMLSFPRRYVHSIFVFKILPKAVILYFIMLAYPNVIDSKKESILLLLFTALILLYKYPCLYLETHHRISDMFGHLSSIRPLPKLKLSPPSKHESFWHLEMTSFTLIWLLLTCLAVAMEILVVSEHQISPSDTNSIIIISLTGFVLFLRVLLLSRTFQDKERNNLINAIKKMHVQGVTTIFHPSSDPAIMKISNALSEMQETIEGHEKRISNGAIQAVESSRYQGLGEMAALVCHDLTNPLWLAKIALDHIIDNPESILNGNSNLSDEGFTMTTVLGENLQKSHDLVSSLRSYLKASRTQETSSLVDAIQATIKILKTKYKSDALFSHVNIALPENISCLEVNLSKHDVIHIFLNILSNSFDNISENKIASPKIKIDELISESISDYIVIDISDNGTGLLPEQFESMTAANSYANDLGMNRLPNSKVSMGLKLVRRLLERNGGHMTVEAINPSGFRTTVRLRFPKAKPNELKMIA